MNVYEGIWSMLELWKTQMKRREREGEGGERGRGEEREKGRERESERRRGERDRRGAGDGGRAEREERGIFPIYFVYLHVSSYTYVFFIYRQIAPGTLIRSHIHQNIQY